MEQSCFGAGGNAATLGDGLCDLGENLASGISMCLTGVINVAIDRAEQSIEGDGDDTEQEHLEPLARCYGWSRSNPDSSRLQQ